MNDHDRSVGRLLLQRGLVPQDALRQAGERTEQLRAAGPYVELLKVLVDMQLLRVDVARSLWNEIGADPNGRPQAPATAVATAPPPQPPNGIPKTLDPDGPQDFGGFGGGGIPMTLDPDGPQDFGGFGGGGIPKTLDPDGPQDFGGGGIPKTLDPDAYDPEGATLFQPGPDAPLGLESFERNPADTAAGSGFQFGPPGGFGGGGSSDFSPVGTGFGPADPGEGFGPGGSGFGQGPGAGQDPGFGAGFPAQGQDTGFGSGFPAQGQDTGFGSGFPAQGQDTGFGSGFGAPGGSGFGAPGGSGFGAPGGSGFGAPGGSGFGAPGGSGFGAPDPLGGFGTPQAPPSGIEQSMGSSTKVAGGASGKLGRSTSKRSKRAGSVSSRRSDRVSGRRSISERAGARSGAHAGSSSKTAFTLVAILVVFVTVIAGVLYGLRGDPPPDKPGGAGTAGAGGDGGGGGATPPPVDAGVEVVDVGDGKVEWNRHRYSVPKTPDEVEETCAFLAEKAIGDAKDFVLEGQYQQAVEFLESFPEELRSGQAYDEVRVELANFKRYQQYDERLQESLKGDRDELKAMVRKLLSEELSKDLLDLRCNDAFLQEARKVLGAEYDQIQIGEVTDD
ncbi:MAG: hypothetical protein R3F62_15205 [Planctomycetota bacterium]